MLRRNCCWILLPVVLLVGCASGTPGPLPSTTPESRGNASGNVSGATPARPRFNLTGYSQSFKDGYTDACENRRDETRFKAEVDYQMGWSDGTSVCAGRENSIAWPQRR